MVAGAGGQNTFATSGISNMERNTETPSTIEDLILLSRACQSWTNQRLMDFDALSRVFAGSMSPSDFMFDFEFVKFCFQRARVGGSFFLAVRRRCPGPWGKLCDLSF